VSPDDEVEVLSGRHGELTWQVLVSGTAEDLMTMLHVRHGERLLQASGFGGPALYPGELVNEWRGRTDELPYFVMARTDPTIDRLVAVTDCGTEVELAVSEPVAAFGLRFAAAGLPDGEAPGRLVAWREGAVVEDTATPMPPGF
jgi:hypothetical protein